ncbi:MAG: TonB-dependent hemoglobin/transferrin/lactoferrin family receptor [Phycisphaerales bacterium]
MRKLVRAIPIVVALGTLLVSASTARAQSTPPGQRPLHHPSGQPTSPTSGQPSGKPAGQPAGQVAPQPTGPEAKADLKQAGKNGKAPAKKRRSVAEDTVVRVRGGGWATSLDGQVAVGQTFPATIGVIDLTDDLNIDPDRSAFVGSVGVSLGKGVHLDAGYAGPFRFEGTSDPIDISFNEFVFTGVLDSEADVDIYQVDLAFDVVEAGPLTISFGPGIRILDFEAAVTGTATDPITSITAVRTETASGVAPLPGPGLGVRFEVTERVYVKGGIRGMYLGDYGNFFDASAELGVDITRNIGVYAGYRWMHAEADVDDVEFNVDLDGLYAGVEIRF